MNEHLCKNAVLRKSLRPWLQFVNFWPFIQFNWNIPNEDVGYANGLCVLNGMKLSKMAPYKKSFYFLASVQIISNVVLFTPTTFANSGKAHGPGLFNS